MNAIGMFFQQVGPSDGSAGKANQPAPNAITSLFHELLASEQSTEVTEGIIQEELPNRDELRIDDSGLFSGYVQFHSQPIVNEELDITLVEQHFKELMEKIGMVLSQITTPEDVEHAAPKMLELLQQWTALEKVYGKEQTAAIIERLSNQQLDPLGTQRYDTAQWLKAGNASSYENNGKSMSMEELPETNERAVWRELLTVYQKRDQFITKQQYHSNASVTNSDVAKWLRQALDTYASGEKMINITNVSHTTMPMSKVEQYVIHVNQGDNTQSVDKQLIEQFQKVMKTSRLLTAPNGRTQLSITLRPENLGEMMVRLTQINGEMTVRIAVTSNAAKEMLESNIHQLRNMFSPHQVVIERQELPVYQSPEAQKERGDQPLKDDEQTQSQHSNKDDKQHEGSDFETHFLESLMNEKV